MTIFLTAILGVSIVGMISLIALKRWELSTGRVVGGRIRPAVGAAAHQGLVWVEYVLPRLARNLLKVSFYYGSMLVHRLTALGVVFAESGLERLLKVLRHNTQVTRSDTEASAFLREVSAHKKQLLKSTKKRVIYEE